MYIGTNLIILYVLYLIYKYYVLKKKLETYKLPY